MQDFETDHELKRGVRELLEDIISSASVLPSEQKAAASILNVLMKETDSQMQVQLDQLLQHPIVSTDVHQYFPLSYPAYSNKLSSILISYPAY